MSVSVRTDEFTAPIWSALAPIADAIFDHPFMVELRAGTLPPEAFGRFLIQDSRYLRDYSRCLALCAAKATDDSDLVSFCSTATDAIHVERALHAGLLAQFDIAPEAAREAPCSPALLAYMSWVKQTCSLGSEPEAFAAVLPCFWIYSELGHRLQQAGGSAEPRYQQWLDNFSGPGFAAATQQVVDICGRLGARGTDPDRAAMVETARVSARYEWMFWDSAYRDERWPI